MSDILVGNYSPEAVNVVISVAVFTHQVTSFVEGTIISASRMTPAI